MKHIVRLLYAASLVTTIFILTAAPAAAQDGHPSRVGPAIFVALLLCGAVFFGYLNFKAHQSFGLSRVSSLPVDEIMERIVGRYTVAGWRVSQTERGVTMYRRSQPSIIVALLLFVLGIVPGLLYLFFGGRDLTIFVTTRAQDNDRTEVEIMGNGQSDGGFSIAKDVLDRLP